MWDITLLWGVAASVLLLAFLAALHVGGKADLPGCFGSNPGPQDRAENDCISCPWADLCLRGPARFTKEELENR